MQASDPYVPGTLSLDELLRTSDVVSLHVVLTARGKMAHSAYPELGESAIEKLLDTLADVRKIKLPVDELLGASTLNIGTISGGRFVHGFSGEQFAHPDAVGMLREISRRPRNGERIELSAADPLNLTGIVLPGPRIPALRTNSVSYTDGAVAPEQGEPVLTA